MKLDASKLLSKIDYKKDLARASQFPLILTNSIRPQEAVRWTIISLKT